MNASSRMLKYLENKGISKYKFCKETGLSNGILDKNRNLGSDKCKIISEVYNDISIEWLITGEGDMLKDSNVSKNAQTPVSSGVTTIQDNAIKQENLLLKQEIASLKDKINDLNSIIDNKDEIIQLGREQINILKAIINDADSVSYNIKNVG